MMLRASFRFLNTAGLLKDGAVLFVGMAGIQACNLLFQVVMGRCLAPVEFSLLVALLALFNILSVPLGVVSSAINRYSSLLVQQGREGDVGRLIVRWIKIVSVPGFFLSLCCFVFPGQIAQFVHLNRSAPVIIMGLIVLAAFIRPVIDGGILGLQFFGVWSFSSLFGWGMRLLVGAGLVIWISPYAGWGLLGHGIGFYVAIGLGSCFLFFKLRGGQPSGKELPRMGSYLLGSFILLMGYSLFMTGDVVMVKHLYPESAGDFAYAATLGRMVVFVPQALVAAMFPKVVSDAKGTSSQFSVFYKTLLMTFLTTVLVAAAFYFFVGQMISLVFGVTEPSGDQIQWCRSITGIMILVALLNVTVRFALAQRRFGAIVIVPVCAVCYILSAFLLDKGVESMLLLLGVYTACSLLVCWLFLFCKRCGQRAE